MLPPGNRIDGATNDEEFHRRLYEWFRGLEVNFDIERVHVLGDLAVEIGTCTAKSTRHDGVTGEDGGRYIYTYERQPEGVWKIHRMSWG
jgi:ketosteroid isomerase-like protein